MCWGSKAVGVGVYLWVPGGGGVVGWVCVQTVSSPACQCSVAMVWSMINTTANACVIYMCIFIHVILNMLHVVVY